MRKLTKKYTFQKTNSGHNLRALTFQAISGALFDILASKVHQSGQILAIIPLKHGLASICNSWVILPPFLCPKPGVIALCRLSAVNCCRSVLIAVISWSSNNLNLLLSATA